MFATLGIYAVSGTVNDVMIAFGVGVIGFFMRQLDFPIAPAILGAILGPQLESQFRRSLLVGNGDLGVFLDRPLTVVILALAFLALVLPYAPRLVNAVRGKPADEAHKFAFADED
jgi:putative tricarboxylic transport membrane protein